jgi:hypothetical protein
MNGTGHVIARTGLLAAIFGALFAGCTDAPTAAEFPPRGGEPQLLINGDDDFDRSAVAAIMVYQPDHFEKPGWRSFCTATLVHKRVLVTAGHCIQGLERQLNAGILHAAWISFQHDPLAHFNTPPAEGNPASGGWYEIESLHNNPDNPDYSDIPGLLAVFPDFHDSGAITLRNRVQGIQPMKLPSRPGEVEVLLGRAECVEGSDCGLVAVGYGLTEFPVLQPPPVQLRLSAAVLYKNVEPLWVTTLQAAPGSSYGAVCFGDSGGPIVLKKGNARDRMIVALISTPEDPFAFPCASSTGALNYRVDTGSHLGFINRVILESRRGGRPW